MVVSGLGLRSAVRVSDRAGHRTACVGGGGVGASDARAGKARHEAGRAQLLHNVLLVFGGFDAVRDILRARDGRSRRVRGRLPDVSGVHVHLRAVRVLRLVRPAPVHNHVPVGPGRGAATAQHGRGYGRRDDGVLLEKVAVLLLLRVPAPAVREGGRLGIRQGGARAGQRGELQGRERLVGGRGERRGVADAELQVSAHQRARLGARVEEEQGPDVARRGQGAVAQGVEGEGTRADRADGDGDRDGGGGRG